MKNPRSSMKLTVAIQHTIIVPKGTRLIKNDDWITLARRVREGVVAVMSFDRHNIEQDYLWEGNWKEFTDEEVEALAKIK